jgi:hypothetical protein
MPQSSQSYADHAHRPVLTVVGFFFVVVALVAFVFRWVGVGGRFSFAAGLLAVIAALLTLLWISRVYTTRLQDRIIKLEMRVRAAPLLTVDQQRALFQLTNKQIAALRFASDAELPSLVERTSREQLAPKDIKRAIQTWVPDYDRT